MDYPISVQNLQRQKHFGNDSLDDLVFVGMVLEFGKKWVKTAGLTQLQNHVDVLTVVVGLMKNHKAFWGNLFQF